MMQVLFEISKNTASFRDLFGKICEILNLYTQSYSLMSEALVEYVLPTFYVILSDPQPPSINCLNLIMESMIRLLKN
jgi:hypothetical protein